MNKKQFVVLIIGAIDRIGQKSMQEVARFCRRGKRGKNIAGADEGDHLEVVKGVTGDS